MDVSHIVRSRVDRGHHRQHVQRQERRAYPPAAPRPDRAAEGPDLQADRSTTAYGDDHITSHSEMQIPSENRVVLARELLEQRARPTPRSSGIDEGQFFDAELPGRLQHARRTRASASSSPASIRTTWASRSSRCRSCSRSRNTSPRRSRSAWCAARPPTTRSGSWPAASACWSARQGTYEARCRHCFDPRLGQ